MAPAEYGTEDWVKHHRTQGEKPLWIQRLEFYIMVVGVVVFTPLRKGRKVAIVLVGDRPYNGSDHAETRALRTCTASSTCTARSTRWSSRAHNTSRGQKTKFRTP